MIGKIGTDYRALTSVERYDADKDKWESVEEMALPHGIAFARGCSCYVDFKLK